MLPVLIGLFIGQNALCTSLEEPNSNANLCNKNAMQLSKKYRENRPFGRIVTDQSLENMLA